MIYTDVDTRQATLRDRVKLLRIVWRVAGQPPSSKAARRGIRRMALRHFFAPKAKASTYLVYRRTP